MSLVRTLSEAQWRSVHLWLNQGEGPFGDLIDQSRREALCGRVTWTFPANAASIHFVEGAYRVARDEGFDFKVESDQALNPRDQAFLDDFSRHCLGVQDHAPKEALGVRDYVYAGAEAIAAGWRRLQPSKPLGSFPRPMPQVVIIGAYGGDHVGDAGILGGVLYTLNRAYKTTSAVVMSHRPDHTRRLASGLDTPVKVTVEPYTPAETDKALSAADGLVLAGGPMMDLPRVLLKHLSAAYRARSLGLPFILERIGVGPFKRQLSRNLATELLSLAAKISLRSHGSGEDPVLHGRTFTVALDPAFDYLATRQSLTRVTRDETNAIDALLNNTCDRPLVGINLRPIRHSWAKAGADFARQSEDQFLQAFADGLAEVARTAKVEPIFIFFPMNPIQFGMSDLHSAYRLQKALDRRAEMRVWQADPDVDGVVTLLRRLDAVIAMRLHACIFAASQNLPLLGVDYYPGHGGKVEQLFADLGHADNATRIDIFQTRWLTERLSKLLETAPKRQVKA